MKISVKSITTGLAPNEAKISDSIPGGERNFQFVRSEGPASGAVETSDSCPPMWAPTKVMLLAL